jgi:hypothetical protein
MAQLSLLNDQLMNVKIFIENCVFLPGIDGKIMPTFLPEQINTQLNI